ncbi:TPA: hypothetical protein QCY14_004930 [Bacillus pacificus]|nr:hypothetical protein [Bacillus pacificus]
MDTIKAVKESLEIGVENGLFIKTAVVMLKASSTTYVMIPGSLPGVHQLVDIEMDKDVATLSIKKHYSDEIVKLPAHKHDPAYVVNYPTYQIIPLKKVKQGDIISFGLTGIPHGKVTYYKNYHDNRKIELQFFDAVAGFERSFGFQDENTPVWLFPAKQEKTYKELEAENKDLRAKIARLEMELQKEDNDVKPKHCSFCSEKIYDGLFVEHTGDYYCDEECLEAATHSTQEETGAFYTTFA